MRPDYQSLSKCFCQNIDASDTNAKPKTRLLGGSTPSQIQSPMQLDIDEQGNLTMKTATGGWQQGMWVHYEAAKATYGIAQPGQMWAASGPFSGCHLSIGIKNGSIYVAHIAKPGDEAEQQWGGKGNGWEEWGRIKIGLAKQGDPVYHSSIVFVDWFGGASPENIKITRVEYLSQCMGGIDNAPMKVREVKQIPLIKASDWK